MLRCCLYVCVENIQVLYVCDYSINAVYRTQTMRFLTKTMMTSSLKLRKGWIILLLAMNRMKLPTLTTDAT